MLLALWTRFSVNCLCCAGGGRFEVLGLASGKQDSEMLCKSLGLHGAISKIVLQMRGACVCGWKKLWALKDMLFCGAEAA